MAVHIVVIVPVLYLKHILGMAASELQDYHRRQLLQDSAKARTIERSIPWCRSQLCQCKDA